MDKCHESIFNDIILIDLPGLLVFITGIIKFPGLLPTFGVKVKELPMYEISKIHDWSGVAMGLLVLFHLIQNWQWIAAMTKKYFGKK